MKTIKINNITKLLICLGLALTFSACENKPDYKAVRKEVMDIHDKLMMDGELAIRNKMSLDTLLGTGLKKMKLSDPKLDTLIEKQYIASLIKKLNDADESMMDWMQVFKPEIDGKSEEAAIKYFQDEKIKLVKMDSLFKSAIGQSDSYLKKYKVSKQDALVNHAGQKH